MVSEGDHNTTNNIMELQAAIEGLRSILKENGNVHITTDSLYVKSGITQWIKNWKKNGWKTSKGQPVKNIQSWKKLDELNGQLKPTWHWIKSHAGHQDNEEVDQEAKKQAKIYLDKSYTKESNILKKRKLQ